MACLIPLQFRDSAHDLEQESHPLRDTWFKSLARLRDLGQDNPGVRTQNHDQQIAEYSYCCVEKERPRKVIYLYRKSKCPYYPIDVNTTSTMPG